MIQKCDIDLSITHVIIECNTNPCGWAETDVGTEPNAIRII